MGDLGPEQTSQVHRGGEVLGSCGLPTPPRVLPSEDRHRLAQRSLPAAMLWEFPKRCGHFCSSGGPGARHGWSLCSALSKTAAVPICVCSPSAPLPFVSRMLREVTLKHSPLPNATGLGPPQASPAGLLRPIPEPQMNRCGEWLLCVMLFHTVKHVHLLESSII